MTTATLHWILYPGVIQPDLIFILIKGTVLLLFSPPHMKLSDEQTIFPFDICQLHLKGNIVYTYYGIR